MRDMGKVTNVNGDYSIGHSKLHELLARLGAKDKLRVGTTRRRFCTTREQRDASRVSCAFIRVLSRDACGGYNACKRVRTNLAKSANGNRKS